MINEYIDAIEALNSERTIGYKKMTSKEYNRELNKQLKELSSTPRSEFDVKAESVIQWAMHNFNYQTDNTRPFKDFMKGLRTHVKKLKNGLPCKTPEQLIQEKRQEFARLFTKLQNAKSEYELLTTENQILNLADAYGDDEESKKKRAVVEGEKLQWYLKHKNPF